MERREELVVGKADVTLGPTDGGRGVPALEPLQFGGHLGQQNQCEGVIGAAVGNEAAFGAAVGGNDRSAQRTGRLRSGGAHSRSGRATRPRHTAATRTGSHRHPCRGSLGERLAAVVAELRVGLVLAAAIMAGAQSHKVRWPNLLPNASLRHMRLVWTALLVAATDCAGSVTHRAPPSAVPIAPTTREPLTITLAEPDPAEPIQAQD